jgi:enoyl-[acyl-carrier-protein] reductase (NADH)
MEDMEAFSNSCMMYITGQPNEFTNHQSAIMWVLSYMAEGSALEWRDEYLAEMSLNDGVLRHKTLKTFFETIKEEFGNPDRQSTKVYKLCTIMQGDHTVDKHVQSFKKAVHRSGYSGFSLIKEFKHSLNNHLRE